jgi:hypothetical protein
MKDNHTACASHYDVFDVETAAFIWYAVTPWSH